MARCEELGKPSADTAEIDRLLAKNRLPEAAEMAFHVLGRGAFEQVLSEAFDVAEEEEGQDACDDLLMIPFTVFVTTNYDRSLSMAAARLTAEGKLQRTHDVIYPGGSPDQLWRRSIHYLHSDINHISQIVMTDSSFGQAYRPAAPQRRIVETLANTCHILFIATDFTDTDVRRVFWECKDIFQSAAQTLRFALTPAHGQTVPTVSTLHRSLGIKPIYYSVSEPTQNPPYPEKLPPRHAGLWKMISQLRLKSEAYVKLADFESRLSTLPPEYESVEGA